jgi:hypothetical protein
MSRAYGKLRKQPLNGKPYAFSHMLRKNNYITDLSLHPRHSHALSFHATKRIYNNIDNSKKRHPILAITIPNPLL